MTNQVFTPEPCAWCDAGDVAICPEHAWLLSSQWDDTYLHPSERKHAPRDA